MRCKACDAMLNDYEVTRKDKLTGEYTELCSECYGHSARALSDYETTVDSVIDFGSEDVYNLDSRFRVTYDIESE